MQVDLAAIVRLDVAEITNVAAFRVRPAMVLVIGIEMAASRHAVLGAAIAELVDMEGVLAGSQSCDFAGDFNETVFLRESQRSGNLAVSQWHQDSDCFRGGNAAYRNWIMPDGLG